MKIDPQTGVLHIAGEWISPELRLQAFLNSSLGIGAKEQIANRGWVTYALRLKERPVEFAISLLFKDASLCEIRFSIVDAESSWGDWSQEKEIQKKAEIDRIIETSFGNPPYKFPWGEVLSDIDMRGGLSQGIIRYHRN